MNETVLRPVPHRQIVLAMPRMLNPHLHSMVTDGGFDPDGVFHVLPRMSLAGMEDLFRRRFLRLILDEGRLKPHMMKMLLGWRHSGFTLDASVRVGARDKLPG